MRTHFDCWPTAERLQVCEGRESSPGADSGLGANKVVVVLTRLVLGWIVTWREVTDTPTAPDGARGLPRGLPWVNGDGASG